MNDILKPEKIYLFSIDMEDVRLLVENGLQYAERVPLMTASYLNFLDKFKFKATFFVVGEVAKEYPILIKEIEERGHEIACHSNKHIPLDKFDKDTFRKDIDENIRWLKNAGVKNIYGFRAPTYSLTEKTSWAYKVLAEMGFRYSSSVLPAQNPLYGWPGHGSRILNHEGVTEIPVTVSAYPFLKVPFAGGVYFRTIPFFLIKNAFEKIYNQGLPVAGYFHPYDIDEGQEKFMHPGINNSHFYNWLLFYNRKNVFKRLESLMKKGYVIKPYFNFMNENLTA